MKKQQEQEFTAEVTLRDVHYDDDTSQISWGIQILCNGVPLGRQETGIVAWPWDTTKKYAERTARRMLSVYKKQVREERFMVE